MKLKQILSIMECNGLMLPSTTRVYIYKLTCTVTGHYYFGKCWDIDTRMEQHMSYIIAGIQVGEYKQRFHQVVAVELKKVYKSQKIKVKMNKFVLQSFEIELIAVTSTDEDACCIESNYISRHKSDPLCQNVKP